MTRISVYKVHFLYGQVLHHYRVKREILVAQGQLIVFDHIKLGHIGGHISALLLGVVNGSALGVVENKTVIFKLFAVFHGAVEARVTAHAEYHGMRIRIRYLILGPETVFGYGMGYIEVE